MPLATLDVIREPASASVLFHPLRRQLLAQLQQPGSAAELARRLELPRQRINYHLRELEKEGLVELVEERRRGNCMERVVRATAKSYLISPETLGELAADPAAIKDRFSSTYLVAVAARTIQDLAKLRSGADAAGKPLATLTIHTEVRFASVRDRNAFAEELAETVAALVTKYHDESAPGGRRFNLLTGVYPALAKVGEGAQAAGSTIPRAAPDTESAEEVDR